MNQVNLVKSGSIAIDFARDPNAISINMITASPLDHFTTSVEGKVIQYDYSDQDRVRTGVVAVYDVLFNNTDKILRFDLEILPNLPDRNPMYDFTYENLFDEFEVKITGAETSNVHIEII